MIRKIKTIKGLVAYNKGKNIIIIKFKKEQ